MEKCKVCGQFVPNECVNVGRQESTGMLYTVVTHCGESIIAGLTMTVPKHLWSIPGFKEWLWGDEGESCSP